MVLLNSLITNLLTLNKDWGAIPLSFYSMFIRDLLADLNSRSIGDAIEIMDALTDRNPNSHDFEIWEVCVVGIHDAIAVATIKLNNIGFFDVLDISHYQTELNNYYIPPRLGYWNDLHMLGIQGRVYMSKSMN